MAHDAAVLIVQVATILFLWEFIVRHLLIDDD